MDGFSIDGWAEFYRDFAAFVDKWEEKKLVLIKRLGVLMEGYIKPLIPVDTSRLADSFKIYLLQDGGGWSGVEYSTNVHYAIYVDQGHVQHRRALRVENLTAGGKKKHYPTVKGKNGKKYIILRERYIPGAFYIDRGFRAAKPHLEKCIKSFMEECAREVEGGRL